MQLVSSCFTLNFVHFKFNICNLILCFPRKNCNMIPLFPQEHTKENMLAFFLLEKNEIMLLTQVMKEKEEE